MLLNENKHNKLSGMTINNSQNKEKDQNSALFTGIKTHKQHAHNNATNNAMIEKPANLPKK